MKKEFFSLAWIINKLLAQELSLSRRLKSFAGLCILLKMPGLSFRWQITEEGKLNPCQKAPDATINVSATALPLWWLDRSTFQRHVHIEGNRSFALAFAQTLLALRWDIEESLSHFVGDVAAVRIARLGRHLLNWPLLQIKGFFSALSEYLQQESGQIMSAPHLTPFNEEIDRLRADTDRLEKRIQLLIQQRNEE